MTKTRIQYIKEAAKKLVDSKLQRGKHFQKQPQEDRISGIKKQTTLHPNISHAGMEGCHIPFFC